jgi:hypothetical protein
MMPKTAARKGVLDEGEIFIQITFGSNDLGAAVRQALDSSDS